MAKTILIAEDDHFLSSAYRAAFMKKGFAVVSAYDGQEAMTALKMQPIDIVILDLLMPVKDGFGVLTDVKADEKLSKIPIIVASNMGSNEVQEKVKAFGVKDFIVKSQTTIAEVIAKVEGLVGANVPT